MRDLQDSMERETDIREQLKFAEEEVRFSSFCKHNNFIETITAGKIKIVLAKSIS